MKEWEDLEMTFIFALKSWLGEEIQNSGFDRFELEIQNISY